MFIFHQVIFLSLFSLLIRFYFAMGNISPTGTTKSYDVNTGPKTDGQQQEVQVKPVVSE